MSITIGTLGPIERLLAESAIHRLLTTYVHLNDEGRFAEIADLLKHAEFDVVGKVAASRDDILAFLEAGIQRHEGGSPRTWHTVSNVLVDVAPSGEAASAASYYTVHQQLEGFALQPICTGKYLDRFERREGEWRFVRRAVTLHLIGDLGRHARGPNSDIASVAA